MRQFRKATIEDFAAKAGVSTATVRVAAAGMPIVLLTRSVDLPDGCGAVWADETRAMDLALRRLWQLGHRRIAHLAARSAFTSRREDRPKTSRYGGWKATIPG